MKVKNDSNKTRAKANYRRARYKNAFDEIIGDPWQDKEGMYTALACRSASTVPEERFGMTATTPNPARPNVLDFFHDVDTILKLSVPGSIWDSFILTYLEGDIAHPLSLSGKVGAKETRDRLEQEIGKLLCIRGISPAKKYFSAERTRLRRDAV